MIRRGEVVAMETSEDGGEFKTIAAASLVDADPRAQAICLGSTNSLATPDDDGNYGRLNVVTSGQCPALVLGPCSAGDSLCLAATATDKAQWATTGKYLKKGAGCFAAMEDVATPGDGKPVMVWVKITAGAPTTPDIITVVAMASDNQALTTVTTIDGVTLSDGDKVLLQGQTTPAENGVWTVQHDPETDEIGFWDQKQYYGVMVLLGIEHGQTIWGLNAGEQNYTYAEVGVAPRILTISYCHDNYLWCEDADNNPIAVARPHLNRRDTTEGGSVAAGGTSGTRVVNGVTYTFTYTGAQTRTVTGGSLTSPESQIIGPTEYLVGDAIVVMPLQQDVAADDSGTIRCQYVAKDARCWGTVPS